MCEQIDDITEDEPDFTQFMECPKCGNPYDYREYELQHCRKCGWDPELNKYVGVL